MHSSAARPPPPEAGVPASRGARGSASPRRGAGRRGAGPPLEPRRGRTPPRLPPVAAPVRAGPSHPRRGPCAKRAWPAPPRTSPRPHQVANFPIGWETRRGPATGADWTRARERRPVTGRFGCHSWPKVDPLVESQRARGTCPGPLRRWRLGAQGLPLPAAFRGRPRTVGPRAEAQAGLRYFRCAGFEPGIPRGLRSREGSPRVPAVGTGAGMRPWLS